MLLSYNEKINEKYLQAGQVSNGNLETMFNYFGIRGNKLRPYRLSDDRKYWIGITDKDEKFYFNGDNSEEIMKHNWCISNGYLITVLKIEDGSYKGIRLNRMVLDVTDQNIVVNHCGGNKMDNRVEKLSISDHEDNMKELLPNNSNNTGITGLMLNENNTYRIQCTVNGFSYTSTYNTKEEALKDLLIIQKHYGYRHNENLYYMLEDISNEYTDKLIHKVEANTDNRKVNPIINKNRFELSEDGSFYYMYDKDNNRCKISTEDLELVKQGNWRYTLNNGKEYFSGEIIWNGKRKGIFLHRFLFDLIDPKYRHWYIDHLNSDGLDNTKNNMVITDAQGNGLNQKGKGYFISNGKFMVSLITFGKRFQKMVNTEAEAIAMVGKKKKEIIKKRIIFNNKNELDLYLWL